MSSMSTSAPLRRWQTMDAAVISWMAYRSDVSKPMRVSSSLASSLISTSSSSHRMSRMSRISFSEYGSVEMMSRRSSRSIGIPWGDLYCVPRIFVMPRFVATTSTGAMSFSSARLRNEKHSMSSMCTSSMKSTPGTISALPSSRHSATFWSICSRTSCRISPVSPENSARKPCVRELMTSISCSVTTCTTSFRFCSSPSGHCTKRVCGPMAS
mmetsp:Transcript_35304/g.104435  ORF Transcript_35304/g.104435 Transcript_35304/m.104435 type:complete len:212 (-) Transcript_35304:441-1076(-)